MKEHVRAEILDGGGDAVPEPLLVGNRCLTRLHLHEEVDVTTPRSSRVRDPKSRVLAVGPKTSRTAARIASTSCGRKRMVRVYPGAARGTQDLARGRAAPRGLDGIAFGVHDRRG